MNVVIIDDELSGREVLKELLRRFCPQVRVLAAVPSLAAARTYLQEEPVDLVFLDIEMPEENGFKLFEHFPQPDFQVVFTTAHQNYALRAFECSALDYLLKPIHYQDLQRVIEKANRQQQKDSWQNRLRALQDNLVNPFRKIAIPTISGYYFAAIQDMLRLEADVNYSLIYLKDFEPFLSSKTLKEYEDLLAPFNFVRVHRSHLINLNFMREYQRGKNPVLIMDDGSQIPVSESKKDLLLQQLKRF